MLLTQYFRPLDTLRLLHADGLEGPFVEHPASPIVRNDPHNARTAGRPFVIDGALYRVAQDCEPTHGLQVFARSGRHGGDKEPQAAWTR